MQKLIEIDNIDLDLFAKGIAEILIRQALAKKSKEIKKTIEVKNGKRN